MSESNFNMLSENASRYPEPQEDSSWTEKAMMTAALVGGGVFAYKTGLMRPLMSNTLKLMGNYRQGRVVGTFKGIRKFAEDEKWFNETYNHQKNLVAKNKMAFQKMYTDIKQSIAEIEENKSKSKQAGYVNRRVPRMLQAVNERLLFESKINQEQLRMTEKQRQAFTDEMDERIKNKNNASKEHNARMMKRIGMRHATVDEVRKLGQFDTQTEGLYQEGVRRYGNKFGNKVADFNIYIDEKNQKLVDINDFRGTMGDFMDSMADDFTIPFVKINPIRMFYLKSFSTENVPPMFHHFKDNQIHPTITGTEKYVDKDGNVKYRTKSIKNQGDGRQYAFIDGTLMGVDKDGNVFDRRDNMRLVEDQSPWGRLISIMSGRMETKFQPKSDKWYDKFYFHMAKTFDVGMQDETVGGYGGHAPESAMGGLDDTKGAQFAWWDLTTYPGKISYEIHKRVKPYREDGFNFDKNGKPIPGKDGKVVNPEFIARHQRFVDEYDSAPLEGMKEDIYTVVSNAKGVKQDLESWRKQFTAGRGNMQDTSTIGLTIYAFFERLNATLGQAGLALSSKNLGSAGQVASGLFTYRLLPIWAGMESLDWINYTGEQLLGEEPEDMLVRGYVNAQVNFAGIRDALGLTDLFKTLDELTPGSHFLTEIAIPVPTTEGITPIKLEDILPLASSEEELAEYYESGEEAMRKGRFWEFGNTPFIGGKLDYFQPNWTRRLTSDWQYQENTFGSKDEYWEHHALPSIQYPLAPIRHFLTDPYHWEEKHYDTRPYPLTGEIAEIRDIPLIGPLLSKTVGEALKPTMFMHTEEWMNQGEVPSQAPQIYAEGQFGTQLYRTVPEGYQVTVDSQTMDKPMTSLDYTQDVTTIPITDPNATLQAVMKTPKPSNYFAYGTPSGGFDVFKETQMNIEQIASRVESGESLNRMASQTEAMTPDYPPMIGQPDSMIREDSWEMNIRDTWYNIAELGGFYGFSINTVAGHPVPDGPILERASDITSYSRRFWEQNIGNLGGDFNEIFRRMLPREQTMEEFNPIRNRMPEWLPGEDYYLDLQHGDPYTKVQKGELRLPGDAYETMYNVDDRSNLAISAYFLGRSPDEIMKYWTHQASEPSMKYEQRKINNAMKEFEDVEIDKDGTTYFNQELGIYGRSDFDVAEIGNETGKAPVVVRELSAEEFGNLGDGVRDEEWSMMNAMMDQSNPNAYVVYKNEETGENKVTPVSYSSKRFKEDLETLQTTRAFMEEKIASGEITEGDFYDPVSKFRILSDVAPYSEEYKAFKEEFRNIPLTEEQQKEVREIRQQLRDRKDSYRIFTPYQYKTADLEKQELTVKAILDNGMILTEEYQDNPIRIAGVKIPRGQGEEAQRARAIIEEYAPIGSKITVGLDANEALRVNNDTYDSMKAVVYSGPSNNLAETLMDSGFEENEDDTSAPAIIARYNWLERSIGSTWETFAHMHTPYHTKFMQARSPLESYERRDVYGKDWQDWANPIQDFLIPTYQSLIGTGSGAEVLLAGAGAGLLGTFFGNTRTGKVMGALSGFSMVTAGRIYTETYEAVTGERWIPERRREERELTEYMDALKFVKNRMLYDHYAQQSLEEEGFNVAEWITEREAQGEANSQEIRQLEEWRKILKIGDAQRRSEVIRMLQQRYAIDITDSQAALDFIKEKLNEIRENRDINELPELAATALMYYNESEKTLYGYDAGEPLTNFIQALPRTERTYFKYFMQAPEEEQDEILSLVPDYMKPVLQTAWGDYDTAPKKSLLDIFKDKELPGADWQGWSPFVNLDDVKVKIAREEQIDMASLNIFREQEKRAMQSPVEAPNMNEESNPTDLYNRFREIARAWGIENPTIQITPNHNSSGYNVTADIIQNRQRDVIHQLNQVGEDVFTNEY